MRNRNQLFFYIAHHSQSKRRNGVIIEELDNRKFRPFRARGHGVVGRIIMDKAKPSLNVPLWRRHVTDADINKNRKQRMSMSTISFSKLFNVQLVWVCGCVCA